MNGYAPLPLSVLRRGDEIRIGGTSLFFTDEDPLQVVPFDPSEVDPSVKTCTRCHRALQSGEPVVFCPVCGVPYMSQKDKDPNCWTFGPCIVCKRDPKVPFVWCPDNAVQVPWHKRPGWEAIVSGETQRLEVVT